MLEYFFSLVKQKVFDNVLCLCIIVTIVSRMLVITGEEDMDMRLLRVSKVDKEPGFPLKKSTLYKWSSIGKFPWLFVRLGGALFVSLDKLDELIKVGGSDGYNED